MKNKMQSKKEYYVDEILKLAFLLKQEYAKDERERAEYRSKFRVVVPFTPSYIAGKEDAATENKKPSETAKTENNVFYEPLKFTDKEISKMPKTFRKEFRVDGCTAHIRKRCDGRYRCSYEIRYRRNGYNVSVSAPTLQEAKEKFIAKLKTVEKHDPNSAKKRVPTTFNEFALFWFENFHKRKVVEETYKKDLQRFRSTLSHRFEKTQVKNINAKQLQDIVDEYLEKGRGKTASEVYSKLNQIFTSAVKFGLISHNPVEMVFHQKHEGEHGVALTLDEETLLLSASAGTKYQCMFAVALYTGLRPNEYKTAQIHGDMIVAKNSKRKNGKIENKRIPITKRLRQYLNDVEQIQWVGLNYIRAKFNSILPNHVLKDLRKTFNTHCVTSGVADSARKEMMGHSGGTLYDTYTDLPDAFLYEEAAKLDAKYV